MLDGEKLYRDAQDAYRALLAKTSKSENERMRQRFGSCRWHNPEIAAKAQKSAMKGSHKRREQGSVRRNAILAAITERGPITRHDIQAMFGWSEGSVMGHLHTLQSQGLVEIVGFGQQQRRLWGLA